MNSAIILAAGKSSRMGLNIPKPYLKINGRLIVDYSISTFLNCDCINEIVLVVLDKYLDKMKNIYPKIKVISGGNSRKESSYIGLNNCNQNTKNIIIHDAARIFITESLIQNCINELKNADGVVTAKLITDTIAQYKNNTITSMKNRDKLVALQTPQAFKYTKLLKAHQNFKGKATDDITIMMNSDYNCKILVNNEQNFKLTTELDYHNAIKILNKK